MTDHPTACEKCGRLLENNEVSPAPCPEGQNCAFVYSPAEILRYKIRNDLWTPEERVRYQLMYKWEYDALEEKK